MLLLLWQWALALCFRLVGFLLPDFSEMKITGLHIYVKIKVKYNTYIHTCKMYVQMYTIFQYLISRYTYNYTLSRTETTHPNPMSPTIV